MRAEKIFLTFFILVLSTAAFAQNPPAPAPGLHMAALQGDVDAIRRHIEAGTDLNEKDAFGSTPLNIAVTFGRTNAVRALIEGGASLHATNSEGGTPLHVAAFLGRTEIVRLLLEEGADRYRRDQYGNTPLVSVSAPFEEAAPTYERIRAALAPLGLQLDFEQIQAARPVIARLLRPSPEELEEVDFSPFPTTDWEISIPEDEGLDRNLVAEMYLGAAALDRLYSLLVFKNGKLIAEKYFNDGAVGEETLLQSASKSYFSTFVGLALERGCLTGLDQKMMDFFPEYAGRITDARKNQITIRHLLQMRAGYPWEEMDPAVWEEFIQGDMLPMIADLPLVSDPGEVFNYSNLSTYLLGIIVARSCERDLKSFAEETLFKPIGAEVGEWWQDSLGNYYQLFHSTARDAAKYGLLYLSEGRHDGVQIVPAAWVRESLVSYSPDAWVTRERMNSVGVYFDELGYGYQWWSARVDEHDVDFAWGHGGQLILLLKEQEMVIVVTSDPFLLIHTGESWLHERSNFNLVGQFISNLPHE